MKQYLFLFFIFFFCTATYAQQQSVKPAQKDSVIVYTYAYIRVEGKFLSKKLKVNVDVGDTDDQIEAGNRLSYLLTNKRSYGAILNYMAELGYELVNTLDLTSNYDGTGGTSGIIYVMKRVR